MRREDAGHLTPVIPGVGQRFRWNMILAITNRGPLAFMALEGKFTSAVFVGFLRRLLRYRQRLRLFFLPGYSSDLNPDEFLNQDVKTNVVGR